MYPNHDFGYEVVNGRARITPSGKKQIEEYVASGSRGSTRMQRVLELLQIHEDEFGFVGDDGELSVNLEDMPSEPQTLDQLIGNKPVNKRKNFE